MKERPARSPRFYVATPLRAGSECALPEDAAHHAIHVMWLHAGDGIALFDGRGGEYTARITSIVRSRVAVDVLEHRTVERESPLRIVLVQGISSGERMEFTIRKAVELGVAELRPVLAARSVARPKGERSEARHAHWQKVAIAACEQSGRNRVPEVHPLAPLADYLGRATEGSLKLLLSPRSELAFSKAAMKIEEGVTLAAGPEAGFSAEEEAAFVAAGFIPAALGPRVLRTETAALAALAALNALRGDF